MDLDIQGLAWQVNSTKLVARPGSPSGQYDSTIEATISKGYTVYRAVIYETPQNASLVGIVASSDARVVAAVTGDGMARVELRGLNLTFLSKIKNEYQVRPGVGLQYQLSSSPRPRSLQGARAPALLASLASRLGRDTTVVFHTSSPTSWIFLTPLELFLCVTGEHTGRLGTVHLPRHAGA